jgi:hypothetical protein
MTRTLSYPETRIFLECAKKYEFIYVQKRPVPMTHSLYLNGTVHVALASVFQSRIDGKHANEQECETRFTDAFRSQVFLRRVSSARGLASGNEPLAVQDEGVGLLRAYFRWIEKTGLDPIFLDRELHKAVGGGMELSGRIDAMDSSGIAIDWKVCQEAWDEDRVQSDLQPLFYALLLGKPIEFHYHFLIRRQSPHIRWRRRTVSQKAMDWLAQEFLPPIWKATQCGTYPYADPASKVCSAENCEYWPVCKGGELRSL